MPTGLGSEGRGFPQPLSLRCIFYKGAVAGAGFHSSLSVCLGLRRCWISVLGNVVGPPGSLEGSEGLVVFVESPCLFSFLFAILCAANRKERERVSSCFSLAFMMRWPRRHGKRSPGLLVGGSGWNPAFALLFLVIVASGPCWWLGCKVGSSCGCTLYAVLVALAS